MTIAPRAARAAALGGACLIGVLLTQDAAHAALPLGVIAVTVSPTVVLTVDGLTASGSLGPSTVVDTRAGSTGYSVSVSTSGFDLVGPAVTASPLTHIAPSAASVQVISTTGGLASSTGVVSLPAVLPVFHLTYPSPVALTNLVSSYTLALSVAVPPSAAGGLYSGTVTQTVV